MKALFIVGLLTLTVSAHARRDQIRETKQQGRISGGVKSGELNVAEARRLNRGQSRVDSAQNKAAADGTVSRKNKLD